jgi:hypothetical protein
MSADAWMRLSAINGVAFADPAPKSRPVRGGRDYPPHGDYIDRMDLSDSGGTISKQQSFARGGHRPTTAGSNSGLRVLGIGGEKASHNLDKSTRRRSQSPP